MTDEFVEVSTRDLIGPALNWAVAACEGFNVGVITVEEQWARFIEGATVEELEKHTEEYADIKAGFKTGLCKVHGDGYKSALDARAWRFDEDWSQGGPIIEREGIELMCGLTPSMAARFKEADPHWSAFPFGRPDVLNKRYTGSTPLIAAMRCYVASKLGDKINVPKELMK